jgi:hypothetical protein
MTLPQQRLRGGRMQLLAGLVALAACATVPEPSPPEAALKSFTGPALMAHIRTLASDEYEGRAPGTKGEQLTVKYLEDQFRALSLEPGNPDGTYEQKVPLVGITPDQDMTLTIAGQGRNAKPVALKFREDFVAWTKREVEDASVDAEAVFVGYGIKAPEFQWDDFKGADLKGKLLVVLVNHPGYADASLFGGKAMKYYGRWTYKYEKAAELGAAGCLIVHETEPAGYPWTVVALQGGEKMSLASPDKNMSRAAMEGWITLDETQRLFKLAGKDFAEMKKAALSRDFHPVSLGLRAQLHIHNTLRHVDSTNVLAKLTGSDPKLNM